MKRLRKVIVLIIFSCLLSSCSQNPKPVVGSANQFDSDSYLALVTTDSIIKSTKDSLNNNVFPSSAVPNIKTALNILIDAYDIANTSWLTYHNAALAGTDTPAQKADVIAKLVNVNSATTILVISKGGK